MESVSFAPHSDTNKKYSHHDVYVYMYEIALRLILQSFTIVRMLYHFSVSNIQYTNEISRNLNKTTFRKVFSNSTLAVRCINVVFKRVFVSLLCVYSIENRVGGDAN